MAKQKKYNQIKLSNSYYIKIFLIFYAKLSDKLVRSFKFERPALKFYTPSAPILFYLFIFSNKIEHHSSLKVIEYKNHSR